MQAEAIQKTIRETPDWLAVKMVEMSGLSDGMSVLEPSAGNGKIVKIIIEKFDFLNLVIVAIELNKESFEILKSIKCSKYTGIVYNEDFLTIDNRGYSYDRIIAAPPFKKNTDTKHIMKMYSLLAKGGIIVSLTSPFWLTNNEENQVEFREFLKDKDYYLKMLPDNTFSEKGKSVPTAIIKLYKK